MPWVYSMEDFPGSAESGRQGEHCHVHAHRIPLKKKRWIKLQDEYVEHDYPDFTVPRGNPRETITTGRKMAEAIMQKVATVRIGEREMPRGIVVTTYDPETERADARRLEKKAEEEHINYRKAVISWFEGERTKAIATGVGRTNPSLYELESYEYLGLKAPDTFDRVQQQQQPVNVKVSMADLVTPEILQGMIQQQLGKMSSEELMGMAAAKAEAEKPQPAA